MLLSSGVPAVQESLQVACIECALGVLLMACSRLGVCAVLLGDTPAQLKADLARRFAGTRLHEASQELAPLLRAVQQRMTLPERSMPPLALDLRGTPFRQRVWRALLATRPGETLSYGELAARLGQPRAVRAVAGACAANPLAVVVPCHRVLGQDGRLTGYRWGLARKQALLEAEGSWPVPGGGTLR